MCSARRVGKYAPELLDQLCLSGAVVWGRLSPHPAFDDQERGKSGTARRVRPTRVGPCRAVPARGRLLAARGGSHARVRRRSFDAGGASARQAYRPAGARSAAGIVRSRAPGARIAGSSWRFVSRRCRERHAPADKRCGRRVVGACCRGPGDGGRIRKPSRAHRPEAAPCDRQTSVAASEVRPRSMGAACCLRASAAG